MNFDSYIVSETPLAKSINTYKKPNLKAFTLAETLITLTIIGVIAALTIPTLISKYQKHAYVTGLKKSYAVLNNAFKLLLLSEGCSSGDFECAGVPGGNIESNEKKNQELAKLIAKQLKIVTYTESYSPSCNTGLGHSACFVTDDGINYALGVNWNSYIEIGVDLNGPKGPNKEGRDRFEFFLATVERNNVPVGTIMPVGSKLLEQYSGNDGFTASATPYWKDAPCDAKHLNITCTGRVLEEDAMNY